MKIPYVFGNPEQNITPLGNGTDAIALARLVERMWTSFAYDLDPNGHGGEFPSEPLYNSQAGNCQLIRHSDSVAGIVRWPRYSSGPQNFVFRKDLSYVELDTDREAGVAYMNTLER